jgi:hypothetical protein
LYHRTFSPIQAGLIGLAARSGQVPFVVRSTQLLALILAAFIAPELDPRGGRRTVLVDPHRPVHLATGRNGRDGTGRDPGALQHLANRLAGLVPPSVRLLLSPPRVRAVHLVPYLLDPQDFARGRNQRGTGALRADIQCQDVLRHVSRTGEEP